MSRSDEYAARTEKLLLPILDENSFELVDVEYVKEAGTWYLRAYIDKEGGITIDDCELVSRALEEKLDEENFIPDSYILEVSSPGLGRPLKKERDYQRARGRRIEIRTYRAIAGGKEFTGVLTAWDGETVTIEPDDGGDPMTFLRKDISLIRMAFDF